jgi:hypothetical protein
MKTIKSEWLTLWNAIKSLLADKPLVSAIAAVIAIYLVARDPNLSAQGIQNFILVLAGLVVGTYKLEDIIQAIAGVYTAKAATSGLVAANTAALYADTQSIAIASGAVPATGIRVPPAPALTVEQVRDLHYPQVATSYSSNITDPPPVRTDASLPKSETTASG